MLEKSEEGQKKEAFENYQTWAYQLQKYEGPFGLSQMIKSKPSIWVIDYSSDGSSEKKWNAEKINQIKLNGHFPLAYMSIGEAEKYRFYFKDLRKSLLIRENKNWSGNYIIRFWNKTWQKIIYGSPSSYLGQIIPQGFSGVYLDIVDAFDQFSDKNKVANQMANFIIELSSWAKIQKSDFKVIIQNGLHIIEYLDRAKRDSFLKAIDGAAIEDLYFNGNKEYDNDFHPQKDVLNLLKVYQQRKKVLLAVEYLKDEKKICQFKDWAKREKLIPLVTNRDLTGKQIFAGELCP
jgi:cysteinyl-tRNA synthetase, unknown class